jgi:hypothetical protein
MARDSFIFYRSFAEAIDDLPDREQLEVYKAIKEYALNENEIELTGVSKSFFKLIKPLLTANNRRYKSGCRGGRPPEDDGLADNQDETKQKPKLNQDLTKPEPNANQEKTKQEPNVNQSLTKRKPNVNENVNDNEFTPTAFTVDQETVSRETSETVIAPPPKKRRRELTEYQKALFHAAKACFESSEKAKAIMYQDKGSTQMHIENLKLFVARCSNMAPGITPNFMRNVLEHFKVLVNGKLKNKVEFTPRALITPWIWEMVISTLPEPDNELTAGIRESIRGMFK